MSHRININSVAYLQMAQLSGFKNLTDQPKREHPTVAIGIVEVHP